MAMTKGEMADGRSSKPAKRRGSVLVFTVFLLVLLAGIGTAFVMFVNLEYAASGNALRNTQSRATAETGLEHARRAIRESLMQYRFEAPDGFFDLAGTTRPYVDDTTGLFRFFEYHPGITTVAGADSAYTTGSWATQRDFAWLYWHEDTANCGVANLDGTPAGSPPHSPEEITDHVYSQAPLAHFAYPNAQPRVDRSNGVEHAGLARRFTIYNPVMDFYATDASKAVSPYRGEYYVWVTDLDSKLYVPYNGVTWGMDDAADLTRILERLRYYGRDSSWGFYDATTGVFKLALTDTEITTLQGMSQPSSLEGLAVVLNRTPPASGTAAVWDHLYYRYGLERYFTHLRDDAHVVKQHETALNVNTASYEVLVAVLSRIPLVTDDPGIPENLVKASYLAKRICAKRPFVCRIDFEDFLAAHLNADPTAAVVDNPKASATPQPPVRMIYLAMPKRQYRDAKTPLAALTLEQLMETSIPDTGTKYEWLRTWQEQRSRFLWFRKDDSAAPLIDPVIPTNNAFLSVKAFNNVLNSISGAFSGGGFGYSFYSHDDVPAPFEIDIGGTPTKPKFEYNELTQAVIDSGTNTYKVEGVDDLVHDEDGELKAWRLTNTSGHYQMVFSVSDDQQMYEYAQTISSPVPPVTLISGGASLETPAINDGTLTDDIVNGTNIQDGGNNTCDSTIHGPIRAYRHSVDDAATAPSVAVDGGPNLDGDVSWSPRFCFRSRFFKVYVLARSVVTMKADGTPVYGPTCRLEAVYDAYDDKVLWRRWQTSELRRLSDPVP